LTNKNLVCKYQACANPNFCTNKPPPTLSGLSNGGNPQEIKNNSPPQNYLSLTSAHLGEALPLEDIKAEIYSEESHRSLFQLRLDTCPLSNRQNHPSRAARCARRKYATEKNVTK
jgi:hypothetical protein